MEYFETEAIRMSMKNPETGNYLTTNVYTLEGVYNDKGELRQMSIGQLVMAICLSRATELENTIVVRMDSMAKNTDNLSVLAKLEEILVSGDYNGKTWSDDTVFKDDLITLKDSDKQTWHQLDEDGNFTGDDLTSTSFSALLKEIGVEYTSGTTTIEELITEIEEQIDSYNTVSQEMLIDIQSQTSKRDDTYSLVSNVLKSMYTQMSGNANNL